MHQPRGGLETSFQKSKITRGTVTPSAQMRSFVSVRKNRWASPQRPPTRPPASAVHRPPAPKCEKRPAAIHPSPQTHIAARDERRRSPAERTSALRSLFAPRACRCSFSQSKRYAAATTACLLPRAISPPMLTALCFCLASADRICLLRRCIIITDFANVLADMPMSCVGSSLLHEHRLRSLGLELGRRHSTIASLCH